MINHPLLKPEAPAAAVTALIAEAIELGTYSVYVSSSMLPLTIPAGADLKIAVVAASPAASTAAASRPARPFSPSPSAPSRSNSGSQEMP
jgi:deoxyribose-phosphate aldolase